MGDKAMSTTFRKSYRPWVVLVGCCLMCCFGFSIPATIFSMFFKPLSGALDAPMATIMMYITLLTWASVPVLMFGGKILKTVPVHILICVMGVLGGVMLFLLASFPSVPMLYATGVVLGVAYPICSIYSAPVIVENWFAKNTGFWASVAMACVGFGGAILSPTITSVMTASGWQSGMMVMAVAFTAVMLVIGIFLVRISPLPLGILPWGATEEDIQKLMSGSSEGEAKVDPSKMPGLMFKEAIKTPAFWLIAIAMFGIGILSNFNMNINTLVQTSGYTPEVAAFALSASSIGNIVGKPIWGWIKDRWDAGGAALASNIACIIGLCGYIWGIFNNNPTIIYVAAFIGGCGICSTLILPALTTSSAFGTKDYGTIYGVIFGERQLIAGLFAPLFGWMFDTTGSYIPMLITCIVGAIMIIVGCMSGVALGKRMWSKDDVAAE